ncbi:MAG: nitrous oxide reductase family maturation protein NosD [Candidatus Krumholzibacteria bacterium]|nr:nitrous oxide reductase family maturation protein NosD [Candidatus Krumholzibacteria bacterium]
MKRVLTTTSTVVLLAVLALELGGAGAAVGKTWSITPVGGSSVVADAIASAADGDTVILRSGIYRESGIVVDKRLTLVGEGTPVIDGGEMGQIIAVTADGVRITGLEIANVGVSYMEDRAGIKLIEVKDCVIEGNRFTNTFFGIYLENCGNCTIRNNVIKAEYLRETASGNGIHLWYCRDILIDGNRITGHRDGIYFEFVEHSTITNNISERNLRYGLHFMFSHHDRYERNVFRKNGAGVAVMFSDDVIMRENTFEHNWGSASYGLLLKDIRDSDITHNRFHRNTIGLYSEGSMRLVIEKNEFTDNGYAMKVMSSSSDNRITANNFINNTFDVSTNSRQNFNEFDGNYWSRYQGYDLDRDGVGDVPYRPVHLFSLLVEREPAGLILLRSFFVDLIDAAEQAMPLYTPPTLLDRRPVINPVDLERS